MVLRLCIVLLPDWIPFLASDNLVKSLRPAPVLIGPLRKHYGEVSKPFGGHPHVEKSIPAFFPSKPTRHTSDHLPQTAYGRETLPFADIRNTHPKHLKPFSEKLVNTTRRVVSDPATSALKLFCETHTSNDLANVDAFSRMLNIKSDSVSDPDAVPEVSTGKPNQDTLLEQFQPADINQNFRENERRKGMKGDEVLVIEPDGLKVNGTNSQDAPHLSSPSCLVEPTQQFTLQLLPSVYWKQYNDAARLVDQIKRRTPSLVVYLATTKCTLMANAPQGDIELLVTSSTLSNKMQNSDVPFNLRIRFSRQDHSLEIARHLCNDQGEEWKKRTISSISQTPYVSSKDWKMLSSDEKEALRHLTRFVQICDETEELMKKISSNPEGTTKQTHESRQPQPSPPTHSTTATLTNSFSLLNIAPRPHKLSHSARTVPNSDLTLNLGTVGQVSKAECVVSDTKLSMWQENNNSSLAGRGLQTRFIPSVGWCIRYPSQVSQGGRYRLMFFDGVALDIDVDEDWVELKRQNGEPIICSVRECALKPNLGERMKVFEEFVSLFDDEEEG
ncbi:hypothetical protein H0H93_011384 [Arthromyces matolae]|nr:hypothetical protein H0H93_011384 [Arthromyces matolae]